MRCIVLAVAAASILCAACSSQMQRSAPLSIEYLSAKDPLTKKGLTGMPYFLPDTAVPVTISGDFVVLPESKTKGKEDLTGADYEYVLTITVGATKQVADPDAALMIEYQPEAGTSDTFKIAVGANGLLTTVNSTSKDETAAIIVKLAELAKEGMRVVTAITPAPPSLARAAGEKNRQDKRRLACFDVLRKMTVTTEVNLSDVLRFGDRQGPAELPAYDLNRRVVRAMQNVADFTPSLIQRMVLDTKAPVAFDTKARRGPLPGTVSNEPFVPNRNSTAYSGIVFRMMMPRTLSIDVVTTGADFGNGCTLQSEAASIGDTNLMVADPLWTFVVDNSRTALVTKKVNLTVSDGVLLGMDVEKPSELLAGITLPVEVLKVIASIPAELLSIKVKQVSEEKNLSAAQVELLKMQIDLIKQRQALIDAQNGVSK